MYNTVVARIARIATTIVTEQYIKRMTPHLSGKIYQATYFGAVVYWVNAPMLIIATNREL